ncbi:unnamed protein product [Victoria cruziana]
MEGFSYSSCGGSRDSSPRSRDIDDENQPWDESSTGNYKVKFICSFGGKIHPRPHDNQLAYIGGDTKIISIDRDAKFDDVVARLSAQWNTNVSFKYQLPEEDLDALISVTNDEDLEHLMLEYDRLSRGSTSGSKPARLRLFLFPVDSAPTVPLAPSTGAETKPDQKWFVDALNSAPVQNLSRSSGASSDNAAFLFSLEKAPGGRTREDIPIPDAVPAAVNPPLHDSRDYLPQPTVIPVARRDPRSSPEPTMPTVVPGVHPAEIQRQIHEFQRLQIASQEQQAAAMFQRKQEDSLVRNLPSAPAYPPREGATGAAISSPGEYYGQRIPEKNRYDQAPSAPQQASAPPMASAYWTPPTPDRQAPEHLVYILQSQPPSATAGVYSTSSIRPQGYFAVPPKMMAQPQPHPAAAGFVADPYGMGPAGAKMAPVPQPHPEGAPRQGTDPPPAFSHVVYDPSGGARAIYYTPAPGAAPPAYHAMAVDLRQPQPQPPPNQPSQDGGRSRPSSQG